MGLSGLNFHTKKYHFITDSSCLKCIARMEDPEHYLLFCPAFRVARVRLLKRVEYMPFCTCFMLTQGRKQKICYYY